MIRLPAAPRAFGFAAALALVAQGSSCGRNDQPGRGPGGVGAAEGSAGSRAASSTGARGAGPAAPGDSAARVAADRGRVRGDSAAALWMVMISDFQCPYCKTWHDSTAGAIDREYVRTGKLRLAYLNFPLPSHKNAWPAAEAAMCAAAQGKFWEMHDALFATQEQWAGQASPSSIFDSLATRAGADVKALRQCVSSGVMRPLIQADLDRSSSAGVSSTPTFIIGDSAVVGAYPIERFRTIIDAALAKR